MKKLIAFDLDGTLVDSLEDIRCATERAFPEFGPVSDSHATALVGEGARTLVRRHFAANGVEATPGDSDGHERHVTEGLQRFKDAYRPHLVDNTRPFAGIVPLVERLRADGLVVAVATNKPSEWGQEMVRALMPNLFDAVIGPEDAGAHKPSPAMLAHLETTLDAKMLAYVGDSVVDIEAAAAHPTNAIAVTYGLGKAASLHAAADKSVTTSEGNAPVSVEVVDDVTSLTTRLLALIDRANGA